MNNRLLWLTSHVNKAFLLLRLEQCFLNPQKPSSTPLEIPQSTIKLPKHQKTITKMCFLLHKTYDCQHITTITTPCRKHAATQAPASKDCPDSIIIQRLRSINLCFDCRLRVPGYVFVSEILQEYNEHWNTVDWQKGASVKSTGPCPPEVDEAQVIRRLREHTSRLRKRARVQWTELKESKSKVLLSQPCENTVTWM